MDTKLKTQLDHASALLAEKLHNEGVHLIESPASEVALALLSQTAFVEDAVKNGWAYLREEHPVDELVFELKQMYEADCLRRQLFEQQDTEPRCSILQRVLRWAGRIG